MRFVLALAIYTMSTSHVRVGRVSIKVGHHGRNSRLHIADKCFPSDPRHSGCLWRLEQLSRPRKLTVADIRLAQPCVPDFFSARGLQRQRAMGSRKFVVDLPANPLGPGWKRWPA